jgi:hypothetical protein
MGWVSQAIESHCPCVRLSQKHTWHAEYNEIDRRLNECFCSRITVSNVDHCIVVDLEQVRRSSYRTRGGLSNDEL